MQSVITVPFSDATGWVTLRRLNGGPKFAITAYESGQPAHEPIVAPGPAFGQVLMGRNATFAGKNFWMALDKADGSFRLRVFRSNESRPWLDKSVSGADLQTVCGLIEKGNFGPTTRPTQN